MKSNNNYSQGYIDYLKKYQKRKNKNTIISNILTGRYSSTMGSTCKLWTNRNILI